MLERNRFFLLWLFVVFTSPASWAIPKVTSERPLFNGKDLSGWKHVGPGEFKVENGVLKSVGGMGLLFYEKEKLGNCVLKVVFRTQGKNDNSGVFIRIPLKPHEEWMPVHYGYEVQIDIDPERWKEGSEHYTGTIYSFTKPKARPAKPPPEWNTMEIFMKGNRTWVHVNGVKVTDYIDGHSELTPNYGGAPARGPRPDFGYIGLQNYNNENVVFFKEVSVRDLE